MIAAGQPMGWIPLDSRTAPVRRYTEATASAVSKNCARRRRSLWDDHNVAGKELNILLRSVAMKNLREIHPELLLHAIRIPENNDRLGASEGCESSTSNYELQNVSCRGQRIHSGSGYFARQVNRLAPDLYHRHGNLRLIDKSV